LDFISALEEASKIFIVSPIDLTPAMWGSTIPAPAQFLRQNLQQILRWERKNHYIDNIDDTTEHFSHICYRILIAISHRGKSYEYPHMACGILANTSGCV
jgi:hypothetical protein